MVSLEADKILLERYKPLVDQDLKVTTAISDPNGSVHRMENLAWFWTMDIPRDAQQSDWMSECRLYICRGQFRLMQVLSLPHKLAARKGSPGSMEGRSRTDQIRGSVDRQFFRFQIQAVGETGCTKSGTGSHRPCSICSLPGRHICKPPRSMSYENSGCK